MKKILYLIPIILILYTLNVSATSCGTGYGPCYCRDSLVTDYTLSSIDPITYTTCPLIGLFIDGQSGITLDCAGFLISGSGVQTGISVFESTEIIIENCNIQGFENGIGLPQSSYNTIRNNNIGYSTYGITVDAGSIGNIFLGNNIMGPPYVTYGIASCTGFPEVCEQGCFTNADCSSPLVCDTTNACVEEAIDCSTVTIDSCSDYTTYGMDVCNNNPCGGDCEWGLSDECIQSGEASCGNNIKGFLEECDGIDLTGKTCETLNPIYTGGTLGCYGPLDDAPCTFDTELCSTICGDITECLQYTLESCGLDECIVGPCYVSDTTCVICPNDILCSDYPLDQCAENPCKPATGFDCRLNWELGGICEQESFITDESGVQWDCSSVEWGPCEPDGMRRTTQACTSMDGSQDQVMEVSCKITKKFPFFSEKGIIIVLVLLAGYYLFINLDKKKK